MNKRNGKLIENSYKSSDYINKFNWTRKEKYIDVFNYYKNLVELRKKHKIFRLDTAKEINDNISFFNLKDNCTNVIAYAAHGENINDSLGKIAVIFNGNRNIVELNLNHDKSSVILDVKE